MKFNSNSRTNQRPDRSDCPSGPTDSDAASEGKRLAMAQVELLKRLAELTAKSIRDRSKS